MKKLKLFSLLFVALVALGSCAKQYDVVVTENTGNTGGSASNFNWTGTPPFSATIDGVDFAVAATGYNGFTGNATEAYNNDSSQYMRIVVPADAEAGKVYNLNSSSAYAAYAIVGQMSAISLLGGGKCKVTVNNASVIEGYFFFDGVDGTTGKTYKITKGYFKTSK